MQFPYRTETTVKVYSDHVDLQESGRSFLTASVPQSGEAVIRIELDDNGIVSASGTVNGEELQFRRSDCAG